MSEIKSEQVGEISTECLEVKFAKKFIGYDIGQVDRYISSIAASYQSAYEEYNVKCAEFNKLLEYYKKLETHIKNRSSMDAITGVLQNTETMMRQITNDAKAEADKILEEICVKRFEAKIQAQKIIDNARKEAAAAKEKAQSIISDAHDNAVKIESQAKENLKKANELITQTMSDMQGLIITDEIGGQRDCGEAKDKDEVKEEYDDEKPVQLKIVPFDSSKSEGRNKQA